MKRRLGDMGFQARPCARESRGGENMKPAATRSRTPEPPYCWQSKEALRQIHRTYDNEQA